MRARSIGVDGVCSRCGVQGVGDQTYARYRSGCRARHRMRGDLRGMAGDLRGDMRGGHLSTCGPGRLMECDIGRERPGSVHGACLRLQRASPAAGTARSGHCVQRGRPGLLGRHAEQRRSEIFVELHPRKHLRAQRTWLLGRKGIATRKQSRPCGSHCQRQQPEDPGTATEEGGSRRHQAAADGKQRQETANTGAPRPQRDSRQSGSSQVPKTERERRQAWVRRGSSAPKCVTERSG